MKIGVVKEIKSDEYRVALTPAGALELVDHGHEVVVETGAGDGSSFEDAKYEAVGGDDRLDRGDVGGRARAEGQGAAPGGVRLPARGSGAVHLPPPRGERGVDARARRERGRVRRVRDGRDAERRPPAARPDERDRGPPFGPGRRVLPGEAARRPRAAARRRRRRGARAGADHRRRDRRLQRRGDRDRPRRERDDPRALDRPHASPRADPVGTRQPGHVEHAPDRRVDPRGGRRDRRGADPGRAGAEADHASRCSGR